MKSQWETPRRSVGVVDRNLEKKKKTNEGIIRVGQSVYIYVNIRLLRVYIIRVDLEKDPRSGNLSREINATCEPTDDPQCFKFSVLEHQKEIFYTRKMSTEVESVYRLDRNIFKSFFLEPQQGLKREREFESYVEKPFIIKMGILSLRLLSDDEGVDGQTECSENRK